MVSVKHRTLLASILLGFLGGGAAAQSSDVCDNAISRLCPGILLSDCFEANPSNWQRLPEQCLADVDATIAMETGISNGGSKPSDGGYIWGQSFAGGVLRDGPDTSYRRIGSVSPNEWFEIIGDTGAWLDGYQWYEISLNGRRGFFWGALFCHEGGGFMEGSGGSCN